MSYAVEPRRKRALVQAEIAQLVACAQIDPDDDAAALVLQALRKRGSGVSLLNRRPTTARMTRILKVLGLTPSKHGAWCGLALKDWIENNPKWTEQQWGRLVAENFETIREAA